MSQISTKEQIIKFKDCADIADASYAMLHWVNEDEENSWFDQFKEKQPARWKFKDNIGKGDVLKEDIQDKDGNLVREAGSPTAYALTIEARFNQDMGITKPISSEGEKPEVKPINNEIQSFVYTNENNELEIFANRENYHQISLRTKAFVNRYELVHHIKLS